MKNFLLVLFILAMSASCTANDVKTIDVEISAPEVLVHEDVVFARYYTWPQAELKMNVFSPIDGKKHPAVMFMPGGAWIAVSRNAGNRICFELAKNNFVAASVEYRLIGAASYPEIIGDAKAALRFLKAHADDFGIDKNKIAVMGASAGGYLAVMLGVTGEKFNYGGNLDQSSEVQAVVDFFAPTDLTRIADDYSDEKRERYYSPSSFISLFVNGVAGYKDKKGGGVRAVPITAQETNPLNYIGKNTPPFLIFHGDKDQTVSPSQSKILHDKLTENGIDSTLYIINGGTHLETYLYQPGPLKIITDFLNRVFSGKQ